MRRTRSESLGAAVASLQALKAEHRTLLATIAADAGMEPATRSALIAHVLEEEDERLDDIAALAASETAGAPAIERRSGLTVGSLRPVPATPASRRGTVGSLRANWEGTR